MANIAVPRVTDADVQRQHDEYSLMAIRCRNQAAQINDPESRQMIEKMADEYEDRLRQLRGLHRT